MERNELHIKQFSEVKVPYDRINLKTKSNYLLRPTESLPYYFELCHWFHNRKKFRVVTNLVKYYNENEIIT